jgi:hypothetical protein
MKHPRLAAQPHRKILTEGSPRSQDLAGQRSSSIDERRPGVSSRTKTAMQTAARMANGCFTDLPPHGVCLG